MKRNIFLLSLSLLLFAIPSFGQIKSGAFSETHIPADGFISVFGTHSFAYMKSEKAIVNTQRGAHKSALIFAETGSWQDADNEGYVDGFVKSFKSGQFVFPVGDNGHYRPMLLENSKEVSVAFNRNNPRQSISSQLDRDNGLDFINDQEYWSIDGDGKSSLTLSWDSGSDVFKMVSDDLSKLTIVGYDGVEWKIIPSKVNDRIFDFSSSEGHIMSRSSSINRGTISSDGEVDLSGFTNLAIGVLIEDYVDYPISLSVYPNPAVENNFIYVDYAFGSDRGGKVMIQSMDDNSVHHKSLEGKKGKIKLSTDEMNGGVYWVIVEDDRGKKNYTKLIIVDSGRIK